MINLKKITTIWGALDICCVLWFVVMHFLRGEIPFYHDVIGSVEISRHFQGSFLPIIGSVVSSLLYISLIFSGAYLLKHRKIGAYLSYIQVPFRMALLIPPSIFFILWPIKESPVFQSQYSVIVLGFVLIILSEGLKLWSITRWRKQVMNA